jgi:hypothetical protein
LKYRLRSAFVIARRQAFETILSPGPYVALAIGLLIGFALVRGFVASVDTAGFDPSIDPAYDALCRALAGIFGSTFVEKLFAEGPFLFALFVSFLPVFLFLSIASVFRFGQEKNAGAVELLAYGPADGTSYMVASFLKDVFFAAVSLALIAGFLAAAATMSNLVLGPLFILSLPVLFAISLAVFACGILCSGIASNASAALAAFLGIQLAFLLVLAGSLSMAVASLRTVASVAAAVLQWASPFYYASLCLRAIQGGSAAGLLGGIGLILLLSAAQLVAGHLVISRRGVRA